MSFPKTLKRLLESSPSTNTLSKYLEKLHEDIYENSTTDKALAVRVTAAEEKITADETLITKLINLHCQDVEFTITDGTNPVEGAVISIDGKTATSSATGEATVEHILEGTYDVEVTCDGYEDDSSSITVTSSDNSFTIALTAVTPAEE